jgi:hypothetical protein
LAASVSSINKLAANAGSTSKQPKMAAQVKSISRPVLFWLCVNKICKFHNLSGKMLSSVVGYSSKNEKFMSSRLILDVNFYDPILD